MAVTQSLILSLVSQNVEKNTSTVRILWQSSQTGDSGDGASRIGGYSIFVNNDPIQERSLSCILQPRSTVTVADTTVTVTHDPEGNCVLRVDTWMDTGAEEGVLAQTKTLKLVSIAGASPVTATSGNIGQSILLAISSRNGAYTHALRYEFGSESGWIGNGGVVAQGPVRHTATLVPFILPDSFYSQIPNTVFGSGIVTCYTYYNATLIGQSAAGFTAYTEKSVCLPVISGKVEDCNPDTLAMTGSKNILVQHMSVARCTANVQPNKSAAVAHRQVNGMTMTNDTVKLRQVDTGRFTFSATDSRGYSSSCVVEKHLIPYIRLTNDATVRRIHPTDGSAELTLQGNFYGGSFGARNNTLTVSYQVDNGDSQSVILTPGAEDYQATVTLTDLNYRKSHTIVVTVSDALDTVSKTLTLAKGLPVFDWGEDDFAFHVPVVTDSSLSGAFICNVRAWRRTFFRLKTKFSAFDGTEERQSILLFGGVLGRQVLGVICVDGAGTCTWTGTEGITLTAEEGGILKVALGATAYDHLLVISPESISTIT